jgi:hypothetical protein
MRHASVIGVAAFVFFAAFAAAATRSPIYAGGSDDPSRFTYARLYCTADGETHFQDETLDLRKMNFAPPASPIYIGSNLTGAGAFVGGFGQGWGADDLQNRLNHPTPAVQFIIVLRGAFSITVTDGETRQFHTGEVLRLEDISPCKGHITVVGDQPGFLMFAR